MGGDKGVAGLSLLPPIKNTGARVSFYLSARIYPKNKFVLTLHGIENLYTNSLRVPFMKKRLKPIEKLFSLHRVSGQLLALLLLV